MKESATTSHVRLDAAQQGVLLWRNNTGVLPDQNGRPVRYGLCNESAAQNRVVKSSDYVGITPTLIVPAHVGQTLGVFTAVEMKPSDWIFPQPTNTREYEHCLAQAKFHDIVNSAGGYAGFACNIYDFRKVVRR